MGQAHPIALVVFLQRLVLTVLLQESEMDFIECDSAEAALRELEKITCQQLVRADLGRYQP